MTEYLDSIKVEIYTTEWVDITSYVIDQIEIERGIPGTTYLDRVANPKSLKIYLDNRNKKFTPNRTTTLSGWDKGIPIRITYSHNGMDFPDKYYIESMKLSSTTDKDDTVEVTAYGWLKYADEYSLSIPAAINVSLDEAVLLILERMPIQPSNVHYFPGEDRFSVVFDVPTTENKATTEFQRLTLSELSYIYENADRIDGETLEIESRSTRVGKAVSKYTTVEDILTDEEDNILTDENGEEIELGIAQEYFYDNDMTDFEAPVWEDLINRVMLTVYPRYIDDTTQILWFMPQPIELEAGETLDSYIGEYVDPYGGGTKIAGTNMITPVSGTDYKMYEQPDGTGADLTSDLSVIADYDDASKVNFKLTNTGETTGYITLLQARGNAIFIYNTAKTPKSDQESIDKYNYQTLELEQKYQQTIDSSVPLINLIVNQNKDPKEKLKTITVNANTTGINKWLFLKVGDLIRVKIDTDTIDNHYFVQGIKSIIDADGFIDYEVSLLKSLTFSLVTATWDVSTWDGGHVWA